MATLNDSVIRPTLTLKNISGQFDTSKLDIFDGGNIMNNATVDIKLDAITILTEFNGSYINQNLPIIYAIIEWQDGAITEAHYDIKTGDRNWLSQIEPHYYSFSSEKLSSDNEKSILVKLYDCNYNLYAFLINVKILPQSYYNLNFNIRIDKAAYNNEFTSVAIAFEPSGEPQLASFNTPVLALLN